MKKLNELIIKKIKLGIDNYEMFIQQMMTWDKENYSSSIKESTNLFILTYDLYGIYRKKDLIGVAALHLESLPHCYLGIPGYDEVIYYPLVFQFVLRPQEDYPVYRDMVFQLLEEQVFPNYLFSELKMHLPPVVDQKTQDFLERHHFQLEQIDQNKEAIYGLGQKKNKQKRK